MGGCQGPSVGGQDSFSEKPRTKNFGALSLNCLPNPAYSQKPFIKMFSLRAHLSVLEGDGSGLTINLAIEGNCFEDK